MSKRAFVIAHPRRGGGHAVIEWIIEHFAQDNQFGVFCNSLRVPPRTLKPNDYFNVPEHLVLTEEGLRARERRKAQYDKDFTVVTFEDPCKDLDAEAFWSMTRATNLQPVMGDHQRWQRFFVMRDVYNHAASRMACSLRFQDPDAQSHTWKDGCVEWWKRCARWCTSNPSSADSSPTWIDYNGWFQHEHYRRMLEIQLDLPASPCDDSITRVSKRGGGSSFDARKSDGVATGMLVDRRYLSFMGDDRMAAIIADPEVIELNRALFGWKLNPDGRITR